MGSKQGKVDAQAVPGRAQGKRLAFPDIRATRPKRCLQKRVLGPRSYVSGHHEIPIPLSISRANSASRKSSNISQYASIIVAGMSAVVADNSCKIDSRVGSA